MTPFLAASLGDFWPLILGTIFFLFKIFGSPKETPGPAQPPSRGGPTSRPRPTPRAGDETEEERVRKFMEALGLPSGAPPPPPEPRRTPPPPPTREAPATMRQEMERTRRESTPPPVPRETESAHPKRRRQVDPRMLPQAPQLPPPVPSYRPVVLLGEQPSLDSLETTTARVQDIHLAGLTLPQYREWETVSSQVQASGGAPRVMNLAREGTAKTSSSMLRELLRRPESLRTAVVLREILGPAPGLQTRRLGETLPSP